MYVDVFQAVGQLLPITFDAFDEDSSQTFIYRIEGPDVGFFSVDPDTGEITAEQELDLERDPDATEPEPLEISTQFKIS